MEEIRIRAKNIFTSILNMPYYKTYAATSGAFHNIANHEDAIANVLNANQLTIWLPKTKIACNDIWNWINTSISNINNEDIQSISSIMPNNTYMRQPCGPNSSPDFIIKFADNIIIPLECKSADGYYPVYNSGGIKKNIIYAFCSKKTNSTTLYCGKDIITIAQQELIDELIIKQRELEEKYNELLKANDINKRGISYYTRPMIVQKGGSELTNYFTHSQKNICEQKVFQFIDDIIVSNYM